MTLFKQIKEEIKNDPMLKLTFVSGGIIGGLFVGSLCLDYYQNKNIKANTDSQYVFKGDIGLADYQDLNSDGKYETIIPIKNDAGEKIKYLVKKGKDGYAHLVPYKVSKPLILEGKVK